MYYRICCLVGVCILTFKHSSPQMAIGRAVGSPLQNNIMYNPVHSLRLNFSLLTPKPKHEPDPKSTSVWYIVSQYLLNSFHILLYIFLSYLSIFILLCGVQYAVVYADISLSEIYIYIYVLQYHVESEQKIKHISV